MADTFSYTIDHQLGQGTLARAGMITTPHGKIKTPAFIVVGTKATMKAVTPEQTKAAGAQAVLANAYHLYLEPGESLVEQAGGLGRFMNWSGPTFTDSGGFQVMSLGFGYKKVLAMDTTGMTADDVIAREGARQAIVDNDGVTFRSHIDGSKHRFTPEKSIEIQHALGADITFTFDECTSLMHSYDYQQQSIVYRTELWAERCLARMEQLRQQQPAWPYQGLFAVIQGAQYEDLRRATATFLGHKDFDGFGIGGALEKSQLGSIVRWVNEELPLDKPRHLLDGPIRILNQAYRHDLEPIVAGCDCYTCQHYSRAYLQHLFRARELLAYTLASIHNEHFILRLVDQMRQAILDGTFLSFKEQWLRRYYSDD